jgi:hypothetical protein
MPKKANVYFGGNKIQLRDFQIKLVVFNLLSTVSTPDICIYKLYIFCPR